jgi:hypothetical protein
MPPTAVTRMLMVPGDDAGAIARILVDETTTNAAEFVPNVTDVTPVNRLPLIVTIVPPKRDPEVGLIEEIAGAATYVNRLFVVDADCPPAAVTMTLTVPAARAGSVAVIEVDEFTVKLAEVVPNRTFVTPTKLVPVMSTGIPPAVGPWFGLTPVTVGTATYV